MSISNKQKGIEKLWYEAKPWWLWLLWPINLLMHLIVFVRRSLYKCNIISSHKLSIPVIVIGNINVGGTGKTPLAIYLLKWLQERGFKPGLVTRGYGAQVSEFPYRVKEGESAAFCGDEPLLIYLNTHLPVMVDPNRVRGGQALIDECQCDILICDDGLQHYALQRDLEILVVDISRGFGNGWLLPFGPLREPYSRSLQCDIKVINGESMKLISQPIRTILSDEIVKDDALETQSIFAVAGIGNPQRFYNSLRGCGLDFTEHSFPDHHLFSEEDFKGMTGAIIMTEKDAVKCKEFADNRFYYLPVTAKLDNLLLNDLEQKVKLLFKNKAKVTSNE